jgi:hypothetical protein
MEDLINNLIEPGNKGLESNKIIEYFDNDDNFTQLFKHKTIICKLRNTETQQGGAVPDNIKNLDNERARLLSIIWQKNTLLQYNKIKERIEYILNKYKFKKKYNVIIIKPTNKLIMSNIYIDYFNNHFNNSKNTYVNTVPKDRAKRTIIFIPHIFTKFIEKFTQIAEYIMYIIDNCVIDGGTLILDLILICENSDLKPKYIDFIRKLCKKFKKIDIIVVKEISSRRPEGCIILQNKTNNNLYEDHLLDKKIQKFINKNEYYLYKNSILYNNLLKFEILNSKQEAIILYNKINYCFNKR